MAIVERYTGIAKAARLWMDPDYPARADAVDRTLECDNRFTFESITFALNQQLSQLRTDRLERWIPRTLSWEGLQVGVMNAGNIPFVDLADYLAVVIGGGRYVGGVSSRSPVLLRAFSDTVASHCDIDAEFVRGSGTEKLDRILENADAVIATGTSETGEVIGQAARRKGIQNVLLRNPSFSVAILNGEESAEELEALAEDSFLHDGLGCRSVATVFAPESMSVDGFLESANHFRAVFPANEKTVTALNQTISLLEATQSSCAYPDNRSFLISRGDPGAFGAGHVRWSPYSDLNSVLAWLDQNAGSLQLVIASRKLAETGLLGRDDLVLLGDGQRPALEWMADGLSTVHFLEESVAARKARPTVAE